MFVRALSLIAMLGFTASAWAGYGVGEVGQLMVGRLGNQVYVELLNVSVSGWPCATTHPNGFRYAFLLDVTGGKEMLASLLAAKASGLQVRIVDTAACTIDTSLANVAYVTQL
jgi:hypothetical protein